MRSLFVNFDKPKDKTFLLLVARLSTTPMQEIKFNDIEEQIKDLKTKGENIKRIIAPFLSDNLSEKQKLELYQVGKFLSLLDSPVEIIKRRESPDFIISYNDDIIGLEHERILNKKEVASIQSITELFSDSGKLFKQKYPDCKVFVNFWLKGNNLRFKKNERLKLMSEIADYTHSLIIGDLPIGKPVYIEDVLIGKSKDVFFTII